MQDIGRIFLEKTEYRNLSEPDQKKGVPSPPLEKPYPEDGSFIELPPPDDPAVRSCIRPVMLSDAIQRRETIRTYADTMVSREELAHLLWSTQGVKEVGGTQYTKRMVPSAAARHAFETYLLINRVEGVSPGLYRYLAFSHRLLAVDTAPDIREHVAAACMDQPFVAASAVTFIWSCQIERMSWKFGERAYRFVHLDAGHVCQNLYLTAEEVGCGVCAIGKYDDQAINAVVGADGDREFVIYAAAVGKKKEA